MSNKRPTLAASINQTFLFNWIYSTLNNAINLIVLNCSNSTQPTIKMQDKVVFN